MAYVHKTETHHESGFSFHIVLAAAFQSACDYFTSLPIHPNRVLTRDMPKD